MFDFIFSRKYKTGALISPPDPRDIPVAAIQGGKTLESKIPEKYFTDISKYPIIDQMQTSSCTWCAHSVIKRSHAFDEGKDEKTSVRFGYAATKAIDGLNAPGAWPRVVASVSMKMGSAREDIAPTDFSLSDETFRKMILTEPMKQDASVRKISGYAYVPVTEMDLKDAIMRYKFVEVTMHVGQWRRARVYPPSAFTPSGGYHRVVLYGWDRNYFYFINSWGTNWGDKGIGKFKWKDYKDSNNVREPMVYTAIPQSILEEYKSKIVMTPNFEKAFTHLLKWEGGYVNNPKDPGGETNYGISKRSYPSIDIKNITKEQAKDIYLRDFWTPLKCDRMPFNIALHVFDAGVNMGKNSAAKTLQEALGVVADGIIGNMTIMAANKVTPAILRKFAKIREQKYRAMSNFSVFGKGWLARNLDTLAESLK